MLCVQSEAMAPLVRAFDSGALDTVAAPGGRGRGLLKRGERVVAVNTGSAEK